MVYKKETSGAKKGVISMLIPKYLFLLDIMGDQHLIKVLKL
jgi:hypothetical protein